MTRRPKSITAITAFPAVLKRTGQHHQTLVTSNQPQLMVPTPEGTTLLLPPVEALATEPFPNIIRDLGGRPGYDPLILGLPRGRHPIRCTDPIHHAIYGKTVILLSFKLLANDSR